MYSFKTAMAGCSGINEPACSVCTEPFDDDRHLPKILQCAHTICSMCLALLEEQGRQTSGILAIDRNFVYLRCPTCRYMTQVPRSCIRSNFQLMDVVQSLKVADKLSFHKCTSCDGRYNETDMNLCSTCTNITGKMQATELIEKEVKLDEHVVCSTCLLRNHIPNGHAHTPLQPLRVEMQRLENTRRIVQQKEGLHKAQRQLREAVDSMYMDWIRWNGEHEAQIALFQLAKSTAEQKKMYTEFVKLLSRRTEQCELLAEHIDKWRMELAMEKMAPSPARPPTPVYVPRPPTPVPVEELFYLEHRR